MDRTRFKEEQQNKPPKGFYSSDFMRRGEFTSTIRTEQYRDLLKASHWAAPSSHYAAWDCSTFICVVATTPVRQT